MLVTLGDRSLSLSVEQMKWTVENSYRNLTRTPNGGSTSLSCGKHARWNQSSS